jgi:hypothetical protein
LNHHHHQIELLIWIQSKLADGSERIEDFARPVFVDQIVHLPCLGRSLDHNCFHRDLTPLSQLFELIKPRVNLDWLCIVKH